MYFKITALKLFVESGILLENPFQCLPSFELTGKEVPNQNFRIIQIKDIFDAYYFTCSIILTHAKLLSTYPFLSVRGLMYESLLFCRRSQTRSKFLGEKKNLLRGCIIVGSCIFMTFDALQSQQSLLTNCCTFTTLTVFDCRRSLFYLLLKK